jgi:glutaredoxin
MNVILFSKPGCHLCDDARALLDDLAADTALKFDEVDIRDDPGLFERYRYRIPVISIDGRDALEGRIDPRVFSTTFQQALRSGS